MGRHQNSLRLIASLMLSHLGMTSAGADDHLEYLGQLQPSYFAELQEVELRPERAYVFGVGGMSIIDLADPTAPRQLGRYEPPGHPFVRFYRGAVSAAGDWAYASSRDDGIWVIDLSLEHDPLSWWSVGPLNRDWEGLALAVGDRLLGAAAHGQGVYFYAVDDPTAAQEIGVATFVEDAWDLAFDELGELACVAAGAGGLVLIDLDDPSRPALHGRLEIPGSAVDVVLDDANHMAYLACGSLGVAAVDVTNPTAPELISFMDTPGLASHLALDGDRLYVADWEGVRVLDISDPTAPQEVGWEDTPVRAMGLGADEGRVVVADWTRLRIYGFGSSLAPDIHFPTHELSFAGLPVGATVDTALTLENTGGSPLTITSLGSFDSDFRFLEEPPFTVAAGAETTLTIHFHRRTDGFDGTFMDIRSDDPDEPRLTFPAATEYQNALDIGETAPDFVAEDLAGFVHRLSDFRGETLLLAFFATW